MSHDRPPPTAGSDQQQVPARSDAADSGPRPRERGRHRRVTAPPTNPEADRSDDAVDPRDRASPPSDRDPRDVWIREQRPPHWD
jgi:hypothetical protein